MANWSDLGPRVASAGVMTAVGAVAIWFGNPVFHVLVLIVVGLMAWEIFEICDMQPTRARMLLPIAFGCVVYLATFQLGTLSWLTIASSVLISSGFAFSLKREKLLGGAVLLAVFWVGYGLVMFRADQGFAFIVWLILVVIASDVMGYFAGRTFGGPKFWPSVSPKKTWSGTVAGWAGAAVVGLCFVIWNDAPAALILVSVLTAFAGQLGDIVESLLKRRTGVKDSSNLIPGHGGVLDRFDAISGAVVFLLVLSAVAPVTV